MELLTQQNGLQRNQRRLLLQLNSLGWRDREGLVLFYIYLLHKSVSLRQLPKHPVSVHMSVVSDRGSWDTVRAKVISVWFGLGEHPCDT